MMGWVVGGGSSAASMAPLRPSHPLPDLRSTLAPINSGTHLVNQVRREEPGTNSTRRATVHRSTESFTYHSLAGSPGTSARRLGRCAGEGRYRSGMGGTERTPMRFGGQRS
jgi:hypothetical protein